MNNLNSESLIKLGLSNTESKIYLALIKLGSTEVNQLIKETGFYKANTYQALERLYDKGIISKIIENKKKVYQIQSPESIVNFIENKKQEIDEQKIIAKELAKKIKQSKENITTSETAAVFRGISGVKRIYSEIIDKKLDYFVFGSPEESDSIGEYYWKNLHVKQKENNIKAKMIFNKSLRKWKNSIPKKVADIRFFDKEFEPITETTIYGNKVAFVVWADKPVTTIIDNKHVSESYKQVFNILWKSAKK